jgi:TupA-like ATPgrasp
LQPGNGARPYLVGFAGMIGALARFTLPWRRHPLVLKTGTWVVPDRIYAKLSFRVCHGRFPRTPPVSFNERLSGLIGSGALEQYAPYSDKLAVRDFVSEKAGPGYLVPLRATADALTRDVWEGLPNAFMVKPSHGSGWSRLVPDKNAEDFDAIAALTRRWMRSDYTVFYREKQYRKIKPTLMFEQVLPADGPDGLIDYKFFCFHGKAQFVHVVIWKPKKRRLLYDLDWNKLDVRYNISNAGHVPRPPALDEMRAVAENLAAGFPFVRVDLFNVPQGVFFGELTFSPLAATEGFQPTAFDDYLGRLWRDPDFNRMNDMSPWRMETEQAAE